MQYVSCRKNSYETLEMLKIMWHLLCGTLFTFKFIIAHATAEHKNIVNVHNMK